MSGAADKMAMELLEARKKIVKMLATIVITFAICWAPNQFIFFAYNLGWNLDFRSWYYHVSVLAAFCNSCMNPFIYAFQNGRYRRALHKAVFGKYVCFLKVGAESGEDATPSALSTNLFNQKRNEHQMIDSNKLKEETNFET
ncbi:Apelin receptor [Holothuria leucospilota]|uniref:Apelin receptor n=1 Tax=Holothuria leucospilota TaxID=206669 RepID=A0A9Q1BHV2_HOLLE|nr:Apelin receptor [Holothuria leucospilota]